MTQLVRAATKLLSNALHISFGREYQMRTIPRSQNLAGFTAMLGFAFALTAAMLGGSAIPVQAKAGQDIAIQYLGNSYAAYALSTATSLTGSGGFFAITALILWVLAAWFRVNSHPHFSKLLYGPTWHWTFYVSGTPGALYMTVYQISIDLAGLVLAMIAGMCGIISFPVVRIYLQLWRKEKLSHRVVLRRLKRRIKGMGYLFLATVCMAFIHTGGKIMSGRSALDATGAALAMIAFGAGIAWQFSILADMQKVVAGAQAAKGALSTIASVVSASLMSSISGLMTAVLAVLTLQLKGYNVSYTWPGVSEVRDLWNYCNALAGVCIIGFGTFATKHERVGKDRQVFLIASGSLATSLLISVFTTPFSWAVLVLQVLTCLLGVRGVYLCTLSAMNKKRPNRTQLDLAACM
jgi:hypothetical protein